MISLNLPLRILQSMTAGVALGFSAYVTNWYLTHTDPAIFPDEPAYLIFVSAFTLITMPYLMFNAPLQITHGRTSRTSNPRFFNKYVVLFLDAVTCALWFASTIALATFRSKLNLCLDHVCTFMGCSAGIGAIAGIAYLVTTILAALHVVRTRGGGHVPGPSTRVLEQHDSWVGSKY